MVNIQEVSLDKQRELTLKQVEYLRNMLIKHKDKEALKRLKKRLIKANEFKWLIKKYK